jgi:hypothetical protein
MSHQLSNARSLLLHEVGRFRVWAAAYPVAERRGEWECGYTEWQSLYLAVLCFVAQHPMASWTDEELSAVLYAIARDNEMEHLAGEIGEHYPILLADLAEAAIRSGEASAK